MAVNQEELMETIENMTVLEAADGDKGLELARAEHPDVILLDGFDAGNQVEALATQTFYDACRRVLRPGGILVVNLWGRDREFAEYFARIERAFDGELGWLSVQDKTNVIVFGFVDPQASDRLAAIQPQLVDLAKRWGLDLRGFARDMQWADNIAPLLR